MSSQFFVSVAKRRLRVVIHDTRDELMRAATKHDPREDFSTAGATFHPVKLEKGGGDYYGTIRFHKGELNIPMVVHECFHAVLHIMRIDDDLRNEDDELINLNVYGEGEEVLADLLDKFVYSIWQKVQARYL